MEHATAICPYCRAPIEEREVPVCPSCKVPHHLECWLENKGCSVPGCSEAPDDEAKVTVAAHALQSASGNQTTQIASPPPVIRIEAQPHTQPKSRIVFMLLGLFLGPFGAHNFYAGYNGRAVPQLAITLLSLFYGTILTWPWAIIEICIVNRDSEKRMMD